MNCAELAGQQALVTGAAGDLGAAMARALAARGATVACWDIQPETSGRETLGPLAEGYRQVDVRDRSGVEAALAALPRLDIVCSNAGIVAASPFLDVSIENWQTHLDINLTGCFHVAQAAARRMVQEGTQGRIIFTSSWVGQIPWPEITPYAVSKAGVNMLMKQMARELAEHGIRVNAIAPGIVNAGLAGRQLREEPEYAARVEKVIPLGSPGEPEEIAEAVCYLASESTAYMTGSILTLDGGCSLFQFDR
ncbi:MAG: SDR family NAD(P)-dependent oxidoreductase [Chloroflexi bacterium]|nr:SDR family NAD(P)-dependent oxidoreductase [Chloroflexota bacterium]